MDRTITIEEKCFLRQEKGKYLDDQSFMGVGYNYNSNLNLQTSRSEIPQISEIPQLQQPVSKEIKLPNLKLNKIKINQKLNKDNVLPNINKSLIDIKNKKYNDDISQILNNKNKSANLSLNTSNLLSCILSKKTSNMSLPLTASIPSYKKNPKLYKIYKQDAVLQNEIVRVKNNKNSNDETLVDYQQNLVRKII
jgi:hypothetical protein